MKINVLERFPANVAQPRPYTEVERSGLLSAGVYLLVKGAVDRQQPHGEDEIYYVVRGRAGFEYREGAEMRRISVAAGSLLFVPAEQEHRFFDITEELLALVLFAPPEGSVRG
jgi:mannose-6-phosphate isomerase-like protein (cupin superfamily)